MAKSGDTASALAKFYGYSSQEEEEKPKDDGNLLTKALGLLGKPLSAVVSTAKEASDIVMPAVENLAEKGVNAIPGIDDKEAADIAGIIPTAIGGAIPQVTRAVAIPSKGREAFKYTGDGASLGDLKKQFDENMGYGDFIRETGASSNNRAVDIAAGFTGDVLADPLNLLGGEGALTALGGEHGAAKLLFEAGDNVAAQKAYKGVSTLSDAEFAKLSDIALEKGLIDSPLKGGLHVGVGTHTRQVLPRGLTNPIAAGARSAEEGIRSSKLGQSLKALGGNETKQALVKRIRRGDPGEAADAFKSLALWQAGGAREGAVKNLIRRSSHEVQKVTEEIGPENASLLAEGADPVKLLPDLAPERAQELQGIMRNYFDRMLKESNEIAGTDFLPYRENYASVPLSEEFAAQQGIGSDYAAPTAFNKAGFEKRAPIREGEHWTVGPEDTKGVDLVPASEHPENLTPRQQAQAHANEVLGDNAVEMFDRGKFFENLEGRYANNMARKVKGHYIEQGLKDQGVAEDLWSTVLKPNKDMKKLGRVRRDISDAVLHRKAAAKVADEEAKSAAQQWAKSARLRGEEQAAGRGVKAAKKAAEVTRAELERPVPAAIAQREYANILSDDVKLGEAQRFADENKLVESQAQHDALVQSLDAAREKSSQEISDMSQRLKDLNAERDVELGAYEGELNAGDERIAQAMERADLTDSQATLESLIRHDQTRRPPGNKAREARLAELEDEIASIHAAVATNGRTVDQVSTEASAVAARMKQLRVERKAAENKIEALQRWAEGHPGDADVLDAKRELDRVLKDQRKGRIFEKRLRDERELVENAARQATEPQVVEAEAVRSQIDSALGRRDVRIEDRAEALRASQERLRELGQDEAADQLVPLQRQLDDAAAKQPLTNPLTGGTTHYHGVANPEVTRDLTQGRTAATKGVTSEVNNHPGMMVFADPESAANFSSSMRGGPDPHVGEFEVRVNNPRIYAESKTFEEHIADPLTSRKSAGMAEYDADILKAAHNQGVFSFDDLANRADETFDLNADPFLDHVPGEPAGWDKPLPGELFDEVQGIVEDAENEGVDLFAYHGEQDGEDIVDVVGKVFSDGGYAIRNGRLLDPDAVALFDEMESGQAVIAKIGGREDTRSVGLSVIDSLMQDPGTLDGSVGKIVPDELHAAWGAAYKQEMKDAGFDSVIFSHGPEGQVLQAFDSTAFKAVGEGPIEYAPGKVAQRAPFLDAESKMAQLKGQMVVQKAQTHLDRVEHLGFDISQQTAKIGDARVAARENEKLIRQNLAALTTDQAQLESKVQRQIREELTQQFEIRDQFAAADRLQKEAMRERSLAHANALGDVATAQSAHVAAQAETKEAVAQALRLEAQAGKASQGLTKANGKVLSMEEAAAKLEPTAAVEEKFKKVLRRGYSELSSDTQTKSWLVEILHDGTRLADPKEVHGIIKGFDYLTNLFKSYAILSPGFNFRNSFGAYFNNKLAGVSDRHYKVWMDADHAYVKAMTPKGESVPGRFGAKGTATIGEDIALSRAKAMEAVRAKVGGKAADAYQQVIDAHVLGAKGISSEITLDAGKQLGLTNNPLTRAGHRFTRNVEETFRGTLAFDTIVKGGTPDDALEAVYKYHFDYDDLSEFERNVARRVVPFYTWTRKNLPLQMESMLTKPKMYSRFNSLKHEVEGVSEDDPLVPQWMKEGLGIRLPFSDNGQTMYIMPDLPLKDLTNLDNPRQMLSNINPLLKLPIELTTGKQLYNDRPFFSTPVEVPDSWDALGIGNAMEAAGLAKNGKTQEKYLYSIEQIMPALGKARRLLPSEDRYSDRFGSTLTSFLFGVGLRTNTEDEKLREAARTGTTVSTKKKTSKEDYLQSLMRYGLASGPGGDTSGGSSSSGSSKTNKKNQTGKTGSTTPYKSLTSAANAGSSYGS